MRTLFLSYRRQDSADICDRLNDRLRRRYGEARVFRDTSSILAGSEFPNALRMALEECRVMLVVIGPGWLDARDEGGRRRLDDPADWVRVEVATGLREGKKVVPVLVRGARMPTADELPDELRGLAECSAVAVRSGSDFPGDMEGLYRVIGRAASGGPPHVGLLVCGVATLLALLALMYAVTVPGLVGAEGLIVQINKGLVEVAIALELLRVIGTRRWVWLVVPIASAVIEVASSSAGIFAAIIDLFALCVLPLVMGTLGPTTSARPLGRAAREGTLTWRGLGGAIVATSVVALASALAFSFADTLGLWQTLLTAVAPSFTLHVVLLFGPLLLAWCLVLVAFLAARWWVAFLVWCLMAASYTPVVILMVDANLFPDFLMTVAIVALGIGWWVARQPMAHERTVAAARALVPVGPASVSQPLGPSQGAR